MRLPDDNKRRAILSAAAQLFSANPFHKVRLDEVAEVAGVGKGTLYIYFTSKENLYSSLIYGGFSELIDNLTAQLRDDHSPPWRRIQRIVTGMVDFAFAHPQLFELMRKVGMPAAGDQKWSEKREELTKLIRETLEQGIRAGEFTDTDPGLTALYLPGLVRSAMLYGPPGLDPQAVTSHMLKIIASGIVKNLPYG